MKHMCAFRKVLKHPPLLRRLGRRLNRLNCLGRLLNMLHCWLWWLGLGVLAPGLSFSGMVGLLSPVAFVGWLQWLIAVGWWLV